MTESNEEDPFPMPTTNEDIHEDLVDSGGSASEGEEVNRAFKNGTNETNTAPVRLAAPDPDEHGAGLFGTVLGSPPHVAGAHNNDKDQLCSVADQAVARRQELNRSAGVILEVHSQSGVPGTPVSPKSRAVSTVLSNKGSRPATEPGRVRPGSRNGWVLHAGSKVASRTVVSPSPAPISVRTVLLDDSGIEGRVYSPSRNKKKKFPRGALKWQGQTGKGSEPVLSIPPASPKEGLLALLGSPKNQGARPPSPRDASAAEAPKSPRSPRTGGPAGAGMKSPTAERQSYLTADGPNATKKVASFGKALDALRQAANAVRRIETRVGGVVYDLLHPPPRAGHAPGGIGGMLDLKSTAQVLMDSGLARAFTSTMDVLKDVEKFVLVAERKHDAFVDIFDATRDQLHELEQRAANAHDVATAAKENENYLIDALEEAEGREAQLRESYSYRLRLAEEETAQRADTQLENLVGTAVEGVAPAMKELAQLREALEFRSQQVDSMKSEFVRLRQSRMATAADGDLRVKVARLLKENELLRGVSEDRAMTITELQGELEGLRAATNNTFAPVGTNQPLFTVHDEELRMRKLDFLQRRMRVAQRINMRIFVTRIFYRWSGRVAVSIRKSMTLAPESVETFRNEAKQRNLLHSATAEQLDRQTQQLIVLEETVAELDDEKTDNEARIKQLETELKDARLVHGSMTAEELQQQALEMYNILFEVLQGMVPRLHLSAFRVSPVKIFKTTDPVIVLIIKWVQQYYKILADIIHLDDKFGQQKVRHTFLSIKIGMNIKRAERKLQAKNIPVFNRVLFETQLNNWRHTQHRLYALRVSIKHARSKLYLIGDAEDPRDLQTLARHIDEDLEEFSLQLKDQQRCETDMAVQALRKQLQQRDEMDRLGFGGAGSMASSRAASARKSRRKLEKEKQQEAKEVQAFQAQRRMTKTELRRSIVDGHIQRRRGSFSNEIIAASNQTGEGSDSDGRGDPMVGSGTSFRRSSFARRRDSCERRSSKNLLKAVVDPHATSGPAFQIASVLPTDNRGCISRKHFMALAQTRFDKPVAVNIETEEVVRARETQSRQGARLKSASKRAFAEARAERSGPMKHFYTCAGAIIPFRNAVTAKNSNTPEPSVGSVNAPEKKRAATAQLLPTVTDRPRALLE